MLILIRPFALGLWFGGSLTWHSAVSETERSYCVGYFADFIALLFWAILSYGVLKHKRGPFKIAAARCVLTPQRPVALVTPGESVPLDQHRSSKRFGFGSLF
jgi:hypothetical protein